MNFKFLAWDRDDWLSTQGTILKYDKLEHLLLALMGVLICVYLINLEFFFSLALMFLIGIAWEIKDGLIKDGQGFSRKDLIADFIGIVLGYFIIITF